MLVLAFGWQLVSKNQVFLFLCEDYCSVAQLVHSTQPRNRISV